MNLWIANENFNFNKKSPYPRTFVGQIPVVDLDAALPLDLVLRQGGHLAMLRVRRHRALGLRIYKCEKSF